MKKFYLVMATLFVSLTMFAQKQSGDLGKNLKWEFENGTLTIKGSGEMIKIDPYDCPWNAEKNHGATIKKEEVKKVVVDEGVTSIGDFAFWDCGEIAEAKLPSTLKIIGEKAFEKCYKLTAIELPDAVEEIKTNAFYDCTSLATVKFSKNLKTIGVNALASEDNDMALTTLDLSNTQVETIGGGAFGFNSNLETIHLPKTFKGFYSKDFSGNEAYGESVFQGCDNIKKVICDAPEAPKTDPENSWNFPFGEKIDAQLVIPQGSEASYQKAGWDKHFESMVTTGIRHLAKNAANEAADVYTLAGTKCLSHATAEQISALPKGVYVMNGKKVLVK